MKWIEKRIPPAKTLGWVGVVFVIITLIALITGVGIDFGRGETKHIYRDEDPEGFQWYVTYFGSLGFLLFLLSRFKLTKIEYGLSQMGSRIMESKITNAELGWFGYAILAVVLIACVGIGIKAWN